MITQHARKVSLHHVNWLCWKVLLYLVHEYILLKSLLNQFVCRYFTSLQLCNLVMGLPLANFSQSVNSQFLLNSECVSYSLSPFRMNHFSLNILAEFDVHGTVTIELSAHRLAGVNSISSTWLNQPSLVTDKTNAKLPHLYSLGKDMKRICLSGCVNAHLESHALHTCHAQLFWLCQLAMWMWPVCL